MISHQNLKKLFLLPLFLGICFPLFAINIFAAEINNVKPASDVRVLVDMSGSMKLNDPDNLRIPAIQLMSNLLPPDSHAGVWAFGQYVNMLVPLGAVDKEWKRIAIEQSKKINSLGLFTNIGGAMERASYGWSTPDPDIKRSVILLTDGVVDVSKDSVENAAARRKVLHELLPKYKAAGITIHTIALSGDADEKLLASMAAETDGWYQKVINASELQKVFLKIFEQATERDSVPLVDNKFTIDEAIEEFTLLIFKNKDSKPTVLEQPDGESYDAGADNARITWFESPDYDLITINSPPSGDWRVYADIDPDNRVLVVSNLKLKSSSLPNNLLANEKFIFTMNLLQEGDIVIEENFLTLLSMEVEVRAFDGSNESFKLLDDGLGVDVKAKDGIYSIELAAPSIAGVTQISGWVDSPTFQRMRQQATNIYDSPVRIESVISDDINMPHEILFVPVKDVSKPYSLQIETTTELPDGQILSLKGELKTGYTQVIKLPVIEKGGLYTIQLNISGETPADRRFNVEPPVYTFSTNNISTEPEIIVEPEEDDVAEENNMAFWLGVGLAVNIILIILGWLFSKLMKKRNVSLANKMSEQLE